MVPLQTIAPRCSIGTDDLGRGLLREGQVDLCVPACQPLLLAPRCQLLARVRTDGGEHGETGLVLIAVDDAYETLLRQRLEPIEDISPDLVGRPRDGVHLAEGGRARDDAKSREQAAVGLVEQIVAPGDGAAQRSLPTRPIDRASAERAQAVVEAAQRRLRPILLTTGTTIGGLVPLYLGGGPMWEPMAVTIMFGLLFATILTLGLVPILYSLFYRVSYSDFKY